MKRREFLHKGSAAMAVAALASCRHVVDWKRLRLVAGANASELERTVLVDARALFEAATGSPVALVDETAEPGAFDVLVGTPESSSRVRPIASVASGAYHVSGSPPLVTISGADAEGARNGLYAFMEELGFRFFRDGDVVPELRGSAALELELEASPAFRFRGDMIWDNYLGPRRYCASVWNEGDWDRALLYMARNRLNFLEFYPPLEHVLHTVFPEAKGLDNGSVLKSEAKHALAKKVLARARALGIECMYVLSYGAFPEPVRALYPDLEWRNGFLCAHQPELMELTKKTWQVLVEELGTDHWYAIRHRGEEEQVYSDPCRSVTKAQGFLQAFAAMEEVDPEARITVWTWGERIPDLFEEFPANVRAVHIRHGMANVFGDRGEGREQSDGPADLPPERKWLSGQFTVFGGNETLLQTGWCDAATLAKDAVASAADPSCEGYFQWPEWSNTSVWLSDVIAKLAWSPTREPSLDAYARERHGALAEPFLAGFRPLLRAGNARFMNPPRKRLLVPFFLAAASLDVLREVRAGALTMMEHLDASSPRFVRDFVDLYTWLALRQAQTFEADAYLSHVEGESVTFEAARATWSALHAVLEQVPELGIVEAARSVAREGILADGVPAVEDAFWTLGCDFYRGYPLVMSPEAVELVYLDQLDRLETLVKDAHERGEVAALEEPGWFWHDFPDASWADAVRKLPSEDAVRFESVMRERLRLALSEPSTPPTARKLTLDPTLLELTLPEPRDTAVLP